MKQRKKPPLVSEAAIVSTARKLVKKLAPVWKEEHRALIACASFDTQTDSMSEAIVARLNILKTSALGGDVHSYQALAHFAKMACKVLELTSLLHPNEQRLLAKRSEVWPVLLSFHPGEREKTVRMVEHLPLAKDLPLRQRLPPSRPKGEDTLKNGRRKRTYNLNTHANVAIKIAFDSLKFKNPEKYDLGKEGITRTVLEGWLEDIVEFYTQRKDYYKNPALRAIGYSAADKQKRTYDLGSPQFMAKVRAGIREGLRRSFWTIFTPTE